MTSDITPSTFDKTLGKIAQKFFNDSTGGAYAVNIPETLEYKEFEEAIKQLVAREVIGRDEWSISRCRCGAQVSKMCVCTVAERNELRVEQRKALGIEQTNKEKL